MVKMAEKNISEPETRTKKRNETSLFGNLKSGIKKSLKQHVWKKIIIVNSVGMDNP